MKVFFAIFYPKEITGLENLPSENCIICANHHDAIDPFLLCTSFPMGRPTSFMCKKEAFNKKIVAWYLNKLKCIPVDRGHSDINSIKKAFRSLKDGRDLVIFPEGTRVKFPFQVEAKGGCSMLSIRSGVQIVPCYIEMDKKLFHKLNIIIGEPMNMKHETPKGTAEDYKTNADEILKTIYALGGISWK